MNNGGSPLDLDRDMQIRLAAFDHLRRLGGDEQIVLWKDLARGFAFEGETVFLVAQSGIFRPQQLRESGAALSIRTAPLDSRYPPAYDDQLNREDDFVHYRYRSGKSASSDNESLRRAMELKRPLVWFYGLTEGVYKAEFPVWIQADMPEQKTFVLAIDSEARSIGLITAGGSSAPLKAYATVVAKRRLHQARFRRMVVTAYGHRCSVCSLGAADRLVSLLDAAHIRPDRDEQGLPEIPNGLSLCKIHHSAYDLNILGIAPDLTVHIRADVLEQVDGPMLQHGIKEMAGRVICIPKRHEHRPNSDYLSIRFEGFTAA